MGAITDKRYPKCSELGVLRKTNRGYLCISTTALLTAVGWKKYRGFLPMMTHRRHSNNLNGYVTPESCEAWLTNGQA